MDLVGKTLAGRYHVESLLGEGGMGSVYRATDSELFGRTVVIKVPHLSLETQMVRERFLSEMQSLARLEHLHIIKILGAGEHEGVPYAVVQYVGGGDLRERVPPGYRMEPREILGWLRSVASALDFVHRQGLCHRDVKPANIFFDEDGNAFLSDFGIATAMGSLDPDATLHGSMTVAGTFVGSPAYAPPESIVRAISPAYDQYSLAVTVYEILTGALPHPEQAGEAVLMAKNVDPPVPVTDRLPELPEGAADAVMRALARKARDRFESCSAFAEAFEAGLESAPRRRKSQQPAFSPWLLAGGAGAVVAVAVLAWLLWRGGAPPQQEVPGEEAAPLPEVERPAGGEPVSFLAGSTAEDLQYARELCLAQAGAGERDCEPNALGDAGAHGVELRPFQMDREEVTNARFAAFALRTGYVTSAEELGRSWHRNVESPGRSWRHPMGPESSYEEHPEHPVVHVSWEDAKAFCASEGERLPSEAEWEFVARGSERRQFPWGDAWDELAASWNGSDVEGLEDVGAHPFGETAWGHQDLAGNAAEWTSTRVGEDVVIKGGSWLARNPALLRPAARMLESPDYTSSDVGFRCVKDLPAWPTG